jgi:two-component system chemotaxis response regulator CheB
MKPLRVMIVDDSATVRQVLSGVLAHAPDIEVMAVASDPLFALDKMQRDWPDVLLLDVEMPRMDGITFLKKIMAMRPTPVVICSTLTEAGTATAMEALSAGAVGVVSKPRMGLRQFLLDSGEEIVQALRAAGQARLRRSAPMPVAPQRLSVEAIPDVPAQAMHETTEKVVALGASTGGTQALEAVPEKFTAAFAARLNSVCQVDVQEARSGDRVLPGRVLIAPGGRHMQLTRSGAQYQVTVLDGPPVNRHRPSVDVLFRSVARCAGANALGVLMTGMGDDGARGLKEMHEAGARTIAQDEASCVVFGMPKEAIKLGAADQTISLDNIPAAIVSYGRGS